LLPKKILENRPAIAMQGTPQSLGSPGSCEAQSFGYGLGSYTAARKPDGSIKWDASLPENQVSAAFLYNFQQHRQGVTCGKGSLAIPYLDFLIAGGSPSAQEIPYYPNCEYLENLTLAPQFPNMERFCLGSLAGFSIEKDPDAALELIKELIANGLAVAFTGSVLLGYARAPQFTHGIICETEIIPGSGHGQLVVGYDDMIGPRDNLGALLIQNSFGTAWPPAHSGSAAPRGMAYWSYATFKKTQSSGATAFPRDDGPLTGSILKNSTGPGGCIKRAFQWAAPADGGVYLVLDVQFSQPLKLENVTVTEPGTGTSLSGNYGHSFANGYLYFERTDGHQFMAGDYGVTFAATNLGGGASLEYTGTVSVGPAGAGAPPAEALSATTEVIDTVGGAATIVVR